MASPSFFPKTILVYVGLDLVGDGLMKLPFARALRHAFPCSRITWLAGKGPTVYAGKLKPLVSNLVDEVIGDADIGSHWRELFHRPLAERSFDLVLDTQRRVLTTLILRRIRHRVFVSGAAAFLLSDRRPKAPGRKPALMIRQMLDLVEVASGRPPESGEELAIAPEVTAAAKGELPDGPVYIGIAPGAGGPRKRWPLDYFMELAKHLAERGKVPVFMLGPDEADWRERIEAAAPRAFFPLQDNKVYGVAPHFTIAVSRRCAAALAADCGIGHMFAAADVPLVSLFGPSSPEKFAPSTRRLTILRAQDFGGEEMERIPVAAVAAALERFIS